MSVDVNTIAIAAPTVEVIIDHERDALEVSSWDIGRVALA